MMHMFSYYPIIPNHLLLNVKKLVIFQYMKVLHDLMHTYFMKFKLTNECKYLWLQKLFIYLFIYLIFFN